MSTILPATRQSGLPAPVLPQTTALPPPPPREFSRRDIAVILFRHKAKALAFLLAAVCAAAFLVLDKPPVYTADALLLVRQGRESVSLDPTATTGEVFPVRKDWSSAINSELAMLNSRALLEEVVNRVGPAAFTEGGTPPLTGLLRRAVSMMPGILPLVPGPGHAPAAAAAETEDKVFADAVATLRGALKIAIVPESDVIRVSCTLSSAQTARNCVQHLLDLYLEKHIAAYRTAGSFDFFSRQTAELRDKLRRAEAELARRKNAMCTADPETYKRSASARLASLREQQDSLQLKIESARARRDSLRDRLDAATSSRFAVPPAVTRDLESALRAAETELQSLERPRDALRQQMTAAALEIEDFNERESALTGLQRDMAILEQKYRKYSEHMEQARIDHALETEKISNISIVQPPAIPTQPDRGDAGVLMLLALLLGIGGGIGVAFVSESVDHSVRSPEDLEEGLGIPMLASVPRLKRSRVTLPRRRQRRSDKDTPGSAAPPAGRPAEQFSFLAYRAVSAMDAESAARPRRRPILVGVTSCYKGEGASTVAAQMSVALAGMGGEPCRILLVEPEVDRSGGPFPFLSRATGPRATEFRNASDGSISVIEQNLYAIQTGENNGPSVTPPGPEAMVALARKQNAEIAVFDLPPLLASASSERLVGLMDYNLIVVESERTRRQALRRANRTLRSAGAGFLGAVLNKRRFHVPAFVYDRL